MNMNQLLDTFPESSADPVLQIVGALLLSFTPIHARSESRPKSPKSLLADYLTRMPVPAYVITLPNLTRNPPHPVIMLKKKLLLISTNYLTNANCMHLERNNLGSNDTPPLYQGAKRTNIKGERKDVPRALFGSQVLGVEHVMVHWRCLSRLQPNLQALAMLTRSWYLDSNSQ
ncbi:hypothetical protein LXL04_030099 [Taraxacum kok-saghyz]